MINQQNNPLPNKTETAFRKYEEYIKQLVETYPEPLLIRPISIRPITFTSRFRDAVNSVIEHNWETSINVEQLKLIWVDVVVTYDDLHVSIKRPERQNKKKVLVESQFSYELSNPEPIIVHALAILLGREVITKPVRLVGVPESTLSDVQKQHNVGITTENEYTIML